MAIRLLVAVGVLVWAAADVSAQGGMNCGGCCKGGSQMGSRGGTGGSMGSQMSGMNVLQAQAARMQAYQAQMQMAQLQAYANQMRAAQLQAHQAQLQAARQSGATRTAAPSATGR